MLIWSKQKYIYFKENNSKEKNTRKKYVNEFVQKLGVGDPITCVYQFVYDEKYSDNTKNIIFYYEWTRGYS